MSNALSILLEQDVETPIPGIGTVKLVRIGESWCLRLSLPAIPGPAGAAGGDQDGPRATEGAIIGDIDAAVLEALAERPGLSLFTAEIVARSGYTHRHVVGAVSRLIGMGFAARPAASTRRGVGITPAGLAFLHRTQTNSRKA